MATTNLDFRKIDYDQLIDKPIIRTTADVDTIKTAGVYDRGDGKRFLVSVDGQTITQIEESHNGYRTRTSTDGGLVRGAWDTVQFSDATHKWDVVVISDTEPVEKRETTAWIDTSDGNKFKVYDGTEWLEVSGQSIQTEEMPTASEESEGKIIQYEGVTDSNFTHGYFYECVGDGQDPEEFSWVNIKVQDAPGQAETMPVPSAENVGQIIQYAGDTNEYHTHGHFYEVIEDPENPGQYIYKEIEVQNSPAQAEEMPEASEESEGKIIQYQGATDEDFTHGYFYECVEDSGTYVWNNVKVQDSDGANISYDNSTSGLTATTIQEAIDEINNSVTEVKNIVEVTEMSEASEENEGTIIQYKGESTADFTHGYFYECVGDGQDPETFSRVNIQVQDNPSQVETMPTPSAENLGTIVQYVGDTNQYYTNGYFYKVVSNGEVPPTYSREQVDTQPASSGEEVVYLTQADYDNLTPAEKADTTKNYVIIGQGGIPVPTEIGAEDVDFDNTTSGMTADNVQDAIEEVFQSVSNGKTLIAAAITDKGVSTAASDSFQTMADNISSLDIATEEHIAAYNMIHTGNGSLLTSINNNAGHTFVLKQLGGLGDIEMYEIGTEHNFSSSQKIYNYQIFALNKDGTYTSTTVNYSSSNYELGPKYIGSDNTISYNFDSSKGSDSSHPGSTDPVYNVYKDTLTYTPLIGFNLQTGQTITTGLPESVKIDRFNGTGDYSSHVREVPRVEGRTLTEVQHITLPYTVTDSISGTVHNIIIKV